MPKQPSRRGDSNEPLLKHQADFVSEVMAATPPVRIVLTAPPGFGKTTAMAGVAAELSRGERDALRVLVVTPAPLREQWRMTMQERAGLAFESLDAQTMRRLESDLPPDQNPWRVFERVVVSIDFLKTAAARFGDCIAAGWDLVIVDEVDQLTNLSSARADTVFSLWDEENLPRVLASSCLPRSPEWLFDHRLSQTVMWDLEQLERALGELEPVTRETVTHTYEPRPQEAEFESDLREFAAEVYGNEAGTQFLGSLLIRRWHSSPFAIDSTLRRLLQKAEQIGLDVGNRMTQAEDDSVERGDSSGIVPVMLVPSVRAKCRDLLTAIEALPEDSKWIECRRILDDIMANSEAVALIWTQYGDTAEYLNAAAEAEGFGAETVTGMLEGSERWAAIERVRECGGCLIVTDAAAGRLSLAVTPDIIHYDLPLNPYRLYERLRMTEPLVGGPRETRQHFLWPEGLDEGRMAALALRKAEELEAAFGLLDTSVDWDQLFE